MQVDCCLMLINNKVRWLAMWKYNICVLLCCMKHLTPTWRIDLCYHLKEFVLHMPAFFVTYVSACVFIICVLEWSCAWAPVSRWSCQRAVSMVMVLTSLACMERGGAHSGAAREEHRKSPAPFMQDWRTENKMQIRSFHCGGTGDTEIILVKGTNACLLHWICPQ